MASQPHNDEREVFTLRLPAPLYEDIRREAFYSRRSMTEIIVEQLDQRYTAKETTETPVLEETATR